MDLKVYIWKVFLETSLQWPYPYMVFICDLNCSLYNYSQSGLFIRNNFITCASEMKIYMF